VLSLPAWPSPPLPLSYPLSRVPPSPLTVLCANFNFVCAHVWSCMHLYVRACASRPLPRGALFFPRRTSPAHPMQVCQRAGDRGREAVGQAMQRHQRLVMQARPRIRVASLSVPFQVSVRCLYPSSPVSESSSPLKTGQSAGHHVPSPQARHHTYRPPWRAITCCSTYIRSSPCTLGGCEATQRREAATLTLSATI
jgi:hypothetical protein